MAQSNNPSVPEKSLETHTNEAINLARSARQIEVTAVEAPASRLKVTARRVGAATLATAAFGTLGISVGGYVADADPEKGNSEHKVACYPSAETKQVIVRGGDGIDAIVTREYGVEQRVVQNNVCFAEEVAVISSQIPGELVQEGQVLEIPVEFHVK